jgi:hypothetical protein
MADHDWLNAQRARLPSLAAWGLDRTRDMSPPIPRQGSVDRVVCRLADRSCGEAHAATVSRSKNGNASGVEASLLRLQRTFGNQYVSRVIDRMQDGGESSEANVEREIDGARGSGRGLDHTVRGQMESSFGVDFGNVRVHTDERADNLNHALSARAFATGQDIFFRQGEYNPGTSSGRELLAHELTHVVQQNGGAVKTKLSVSDPGDAHEIEADQIAKMVMQQEQYGPQPGGAAQAQRQAEMPPEEEDKEKEPVAMKAADSSVSRDVEEEPH